MYKYDRRKKLNVSCDFENKTPTHMDATRAMSISERNFQIRILRELDQTLGILRFSVIHWFTSNNRK